MISKILQKELQIPYIVRPIKILTKCIIYTFFISYIIWNFIVHINPNPMPKNILQENNSINEKYSINIATQQHIVFIEYIKFMTKVARFDWGEVANGEDSRLTLIIDKMSTTLLFLGCALITSIFLSILLLIINTKIKLKINRNTNLLNPSFLHIGIIFILIKLFIFDYQSNINMPSYAILLLSSFIVSIGSGILIDFYLLIKEDYQNIMKKDYVVFAKDSGFNYYRFAFKELCFNLLNISLSRIPIIFGGLIIVEYEFMNQNYDGISRLIFKFMQGDNVSLFLCVLCCISFFSFFYFLSEHIQKEVMKK